MPIPARRFINIVLTIAALSFSLNATTKAQPESPDATPLPATPTLNGNRKWRIGYYEGGPYWEYRETLVALVKALMEMSWIEQQPIPEIEGESVRSLWDWLSTEQRSEYIDFLPQRFYSAQWQLSQRAPIVDTLLRVLKTPGEIDLLIAMGTIAGQDTANDEHSVATLVWASSDALRAGIVTNEKSSGRAHIHATVYPTRYEKQLRAFHDIVGFEKLGVMYENTSNGRVYSGIDAVERVAVERKFEIVRCHLLDENSDTQEQRDITALACFNELAESSDAIYVTQNLGVNQQTIPNLVQIANQKKVPTFSQSDSNEVRYGFLLSLSQAEYRYIGRFNATVFAQVLNGAVPGQLNQIFEPPTSLAVNLRTAEILGFYLDASVLAAADELYEEIEPPTEPK